MGFGPLARHRGRAIVRDDGPPDYFFFGLSAAGLADFGAT
jgi:hypothetical protein